MRQELDAALIALSAMEQAAKHATFWTEAFSALSVAWEYVDGDFRAHCRVTQRRPDEYAWYVEGPSASKLGECDTAGRAIATAQTVARDLLNDVREAREREQRQSTRHAGRTTRKVRPAKSRMPLVATGGVGRNRR